MRHFSDHAVRSVNGVLEVRNGDHDEIVEIDQEGNVELLSAGSGIVCRSPDGSERKMIGIDDDGDIEVRDV